MVPEKDVAGDVMVPLAEASGRILPLELPISQAARAHARQKRAQQVISRIKGDVLLFIRWPPQNVLPFFPVTPVSATLSRMPEKKHRFRK
jgi:hypothetical protein